MSNEDAKSVLNAAESAIFSLDLAKDNIERYLTLHGLTKSAKGEVTGKAAEFNMGGLAAKAEFDSVINQSLELAVRNLEQFVASQKK